MNALSEMAVGDLFTTILPFILAGAFGPAAVTILVQLLRTSALRGAVSKACSTAGVWFSFTMTGVVNKFGGDGAWTKIEDALEDFVEEVVWKSFKSGLNKDDKPATKGK